MKSVLDDNKLGNCKSMINLKLMYIYALTADTQLQPGFFDGWRNIFADDWMKAGIMG